MQHITCIKILLGGNYGIDNEGDGDGDILYVIDENNQDNYTLMTEQLIY